VRALRETFPSAEIVVVDNASTDGTFAAALRTGEAVVVREPLPGKGRAMRMGALAATRDVLLFHDADFEYHCTDARAVVRAVLAPAGGGPCAMAIGVRAWRLSWLPVVSFTVNALIRAILQLRFGAAPEDVLTGTRCLSREYFLALDTSSATFAIETELSRLVLATGGEVVGVPVRYTPRTRAQGKKISVRHLWPIIAEACATRTPALVAREGITARAQ
jgi:glycosyltransferase involved in cell wall biosynthesis